MATANTLTGGGTMLDAAKRIGADGQQLMVVDVLSSQTFMQDAFWVEANDFTTHHYMQTLSEPTGTDTVINQGIVWEIGTERPVTEIIQGLESYSKIDARILADEPDPVGYRRAKDVECVNGLRKSVDDRILYGGTSVHVAGGSSAVSPYQITGLHPRFNKISGITYNQLQGTQYWLPNVVSAAGSTANVQSSVWVVKWGKDGLFMTYPRSGRGFIDVKPRPDTTIILDSSNNPYEIEITHFSIKFGLCVGDWRNVLRMCNINKATDSKPWTSDLMISLLAVLPDTDWTGLVLYVNRTVWQQILLEAKNDSNVFHFDEAPWGTKTPYFMGIPIKPVDRIASTEPVIS